MIYYTEIQMLQIKWILTNMQLHSTVKGLMERWAVKLCLINTISDY